MKLKPIYDSLIREVSDDLYNFVKSNFSKERIIMDSIGNKKWDRLKVINTNQKVGGSKPVGLWYSIGTDWVDWVRDNMPHWEGENLYIIDINPNNILHLNTEEKVIEFSNLYSVKNGRESGRGFDIDWVKVAQKYSGIEISPYQYGLRFEYLWYYTWDIASGCLWNNNAVNNIKKIELSSDNNL